jgi:hypothetical protein
MRFIKANRVQMQSTYRRAFGLPASAFGRNPAPASIAPEHNAAINAENPVVARFEI